MDKELEELLAKSKAMVEAMSPAEYAAMIQRQRESYVRAEMAFGSDADEAEYRRRMQAGEQMHDTPSGAEPSPTNPTIAHLMALVDREFPPR